MSRRLCLLGLLLCACAAGEGGALPRVFVMYPTNGLGDRSFADSVYRGVEMARLERDFTVTMANPKSDEDRRATLERWAAEPLQSDRELIISVGLYCGDAVEAAACQYNGRKVLHLDSNLTDCPGLLSVAYRPFAPSFLAGVAAMQVSPSRTAAVMAAMNISVIDEFIRGFRAGVEHEGGRLIGVEYLSDTEQGFADPVKAWEVAERFYGQTEVIFSLCGSSSLSVFELAKQKPGRYTFGIDMNESWLWMGRGVILGSVYKRLDLSVLRAIRAALSGAFQPGPVSVGLADDGVAFGLNDVFADQAAQAVSDAREAAIRAEEQDRAEGRR